MLYLQRLGKNVVCCVQKNIQRLEEGLETTKCSFWTWSDPSGREYNNICRFHREDVSLEYNGGTISGPEGCYALWNC